LFVAVNATSPTQAACGLASRRSLSESRWADGLSLARRWRRGQGPRVLVQSKRNKHVGAVSFSGPRASFGQSPVANGDGSCLIAEISLRPCQSGAWRDPL